MDPSLFHLFRTLTPAEALLLLQPKDTKRRTLLQLTLQDLLQKHVLKLNLEGPPEEEKVWIALGSSSARYVYKAHEEMLLRPLEKQAGNRLLFRDYIKILVERSWPDKRFKFEIIGHTPELVPFFRQTGWKQWFQIQALNRHGQETSKLLREALIKAENQFQENISEEDLKKMLSSLGSHILLLDGMTDALLDEIKLALTGKFNSITGYSISLKNASGEMYQETGEIDSPVNFERTGYA
jgi:hypothetical protein